jgi:hypothetical protein
MASDMNDKSFKLKKFIIIKFKFRTVAMTY